MEFKERRRNTVDKNTEAFVLVLTKNNCLSYICNTCGSNDFILLAVNNRPCCRPCAWGPKPSKKKD